MDDHHLEWLRLVQLPVTRRVRVDQVAEVGKLVIEKPEVVVVVPTSKEEVDVSVVMELAGDVLERSTGDEV